MVYQKKKGIKLPENPNHIHYMMDNYTRHFNIILSSTKAGKATNKKMNQ
jgi:hypothetical protein